MTVFSLFFFLLLPPPPRSTLFPYTTLFRSHLGPVHHADAERFLEVDALDRGEAFVEQQQRRPRVAELGLERLDLALPQEEVGGGGVDPLEGAADDVGAGGIGEPRQLVEVLLGTQ